MDALIRELIPHDPSLGLYVAPDIPADKLQNAIGDYAKKVNRRDVVALYDATLMGSAKDGALFLADRLVFQNNNLEPGYDVRYADIVEVEKKKKLLGGQRLVLTVNRGRATIELEIDFSGKAKAAPYVARFLKDALWRSMEDDDDRPAVTQDEPVTRSGRATETDIRAVEETLIELVRGGQLTQADYREMMRALGR